jgi:hypothetical protein
MSEKFPHKVQISRVASNGSYGEYIRYIDRKEKIYQWIEVNIGIRGDTDNPCWIEDRPNLFAFSDKKNATLFKMFWG